jgi:hypothetical protein
MIVGREHIAGLQAALELWNDGGPIVQYAHALADMFEQARAEPVQGEGVEVVAWRTNRDEDSTFPRLHRGESEAQSWVIYCNNGPRITKEPLMTVAQHNRIMAAAKPDADLIALKALLPTLDNALEDLELHGRHGDQGYRELKEWYRKMAVATARIDAALTKLQP